MKITKSGQSVSVESRCRVLGDALPYVSRGGLKLEAALETFDIVPSQRVCLDIGLSTGGFTDVLLKKNNDFQILYALSVSYLTLSKYEEAERFFKRIVSLKPNAENNYIYGNIQKQLKNYNEATKYFLNAVNLKPDYSEAYNNLGNTKLKLGFVIKKKYFGKTIFEIMSPLPLTKLSC